jgi:hypothetical protein
MLEFRSDSVRFGSVRFGSVRFGFSFYISTVPCNAQHLVYFTIPRMRTPLRIILQITIELRDEELDASEGARARGAHYRYSLICSSDIDTLRIPSISRIKVQARRLNVAEEISCVGSVMDGTYSRTTMPLSLSTAQHSSDSTAQHSTARYGTEIQPSNGILNACMHVLLLSAPLGAADRRACRPSLIAQLNQNKQCSKKTIRGQQRMVQINYKKAVTSAYPEAGSFFFVNSSTQPTTADCRIIPSPHIFYRFYLCCSIQWRRRASVDESPVA